MKVILTEGDYCYSSTYNIRLISFRKSLCPQKFLYKWKRQYLCEYVKQINNLIPYWKKQMHKFYITIGSSFDEDAIKWYHYRRLYNLYVSLDQYLPLLDCSERLEIIFIRNTFCRIKGTIGLNETNKQWETIIRANIMELALSTLEKNSIKYFLENNIKCSFQKPYKDYLEDDYLSLKNAVILMKSISQEDKELIQLYDTDFILADVCEHEDYDQSPLMINWNNPMKHLNVIFQSADRNYNTVK